MNWIPLRVLSRPLTLLLTGMSLLVLLRGHNEPGGGFIGGLLAAAGFVIYALASGAPAARRILRVSPTTLIAAGLLAATASGLPALLQGKEFMTAWWWGQLLEIGKVGTVLVFDAGVYLVVLGAVSLMLLRLLDPDAGRRPEGGP